MAALLPIIDHPAAAVLFGGGLVCAAAVAVAAGRRAGASAGVLAGCLAAAGLLLGASEGERPLLAALWLHHAATVVMKAAALARSRERMALPRLVVYLSIWPGLDPRTAVTRDPPPDRGAAGRLAARAAAEVVAAVLVGRVVRHVGIDDWPLLAASTVRALAFTLLIDGWMTLAVALARLAGGRCEDAFREPWRAATLAEFWGERWNRFVGRSLGDGVFRPVARRAGPSWGLVAAFVASGLLHELLWNVPGRGPPGAFLAFFTVQAVAVLAFARLLPGPGATPRARLVRRVAAFGVLLATAPLFCGAAFRALLW